MDVGGKREDCVDEDKQDMNHMEGPGHDVVGTSDAHSASEIKETKNKEQARDDTSLRLPMANVGGSSS